MAELDVAETIRKDVTEGMEKQQKEFLLRQQLAAVRKELKELSGGGKGTEEDDYRTRVEAADLPENVREAALREVDKLERTPEHRRKSAGSGPGSTPSLTSVERADRRRLRHRPRAAILDEDHTGLDDVKDRIIEYLAMRKRRSYRGLGVIGGRRSGAVLALVGPPVVAKTSLGIGRPGHGPQVRPRRARRRPRRGRDPQSPAHLRRRAARPDRPRHPRGRHDEPVVLLDEVDKIGSDYRGDPAAALLEVLDPAQNHTFRDHYLEVDLEPSDVVFLATANVLDTIPGPLLDRMELVPLDGYTEDEKVAIARDHLLSRQLARRACPPTRLRSTTTRCG